MPSPLGVRPYSRAAEVDTFVVFVSEAARQDAFQVGKEHE